MLRLHICNVLFMRDAEYCREDFDLVFSYPRKKHRSVALAYALLASKGVDSL
jgi:hypothetical protein